MRARTTSRFQGTGNHENGRCPSAAARRTAAIPLERKPVTEAEIAEFARTRDARLRERIITGSAPLVHWVAAKFRRADAEFADLIQVAWIALIGALDRYDASHGAAFSGYAVRCMVGAVKRYFRDCTWAVRVPRRLHDLSVRLPVIQERLIADLGRAPTLHEIAARCGASEEEVAAAIDVGQGHWVVSLQEARSEDQRHEPLSLEEQLGTDDPGIAACIEREATEELLGRLARRERLILRRRYCDEQSQRQVGCELGISQMQVSRLEHAALHQLRSAAA
jgi:RNA polymerase sigma-B factor